ncbi:hypothetical protein N7495_000978 [Penicillium taxi]|uniref:uncharacterized protein n=1 Tax=Penicillium taxi TaxID=168475 RepID=UPI0025455A86|nr:uncharacterized protein N7495_000978 [Penicillium taxi]KAJ5908296.1 hypothetical protein N7495_000978 [Penicillium taxi]
MADQAEHPLGSDQLEDSPTAPESPANADILTKTEGNEELATDQQDVESNSEDGEIKEAEELSAPPLPDEAPPPLPNEAPPAKEDDDGWDPFWDDKVKAFYFYNRFTGVYQWENPRLPGAAVSGAVASATDVPADVPAEESSNTEKPEVLRYIPSIHGDYDPTAPYAQKPEEPEEGSNIHVDPSAAYAATGTFNRFTGQWQASTITPENYNAENKSYRQMHAFYDVDAAANNHDGRSLKAERSAQRITKSQMKGFKKKAREKKEEKRRAWLRD